MIDTRRHTENATPDHNRVLHRAEQNGEREAMEQRTSSDPQGVPDQSEVVRARRHEQPPGGVQEEEAGALDQAVTLLERRP